MTAGFDLASAQFGTEPAEDEEDGQTPVNSDEQGRSGIGTALGDTFGRPSTFSVHPAPLGAQFSGASPGGSFGGSGAVRPPATPPGESDRALAINAHTANSVAQFHGSSRAPINGRSALDYQRATFGAPQGQQQ